ncbi:hypothetical protein G6F43_010584 [Rhizopus delemar]|nr:hypothetical protein G6F43_010584 [Rhizopus delemar]
MATAALPAGLADASGDLVRKMLLDTLEDYHQQFITFFGADGYEDIRTALSFPPDETSDWWFIAPDFLWILVATFGVPFLYADDEFEKAWLCNVPGRETFEEEVHFLLRKQTNHFLMYKVNHYICDETDEALEQDEFNRLFRDILSQ